MNIISNTTKFISLLIGTLCLIYPFVFETNKLSLFVTIGCCYLLGTWVLANLEKESFNGNEEEWKERKNILVGLGICVVVALSLLFYYEQQMPRMDVAHINTELYKVPPQLSRTQLRDYGAQCNTYGDTKCSLAVFEKLVKLDPRDLKALANLAMAQTHLGYHKQASFNFNSLIQKGFVTYDIFQFYGDTLQAQGHTEEAIKAYEQALMLNPELNETKSKLEKLRVTSN